MFSFDLVMFKDNYSRGNIYFQHHYKKIREHQNFICQKHLKKKSNWKISTLNLKKKQPSHYHQSKSFSWFGKIDDSFFIFKKMISKKEKFHKLVKTCKDLASTKCNTIKVNDNYLLLFFVRCWKKAKQLLFLILCKSVLRT